MADFRLSGNVNIGGFLKGIVDGSTRKDVESTRDRIHEGVEKTRNGIRKGIDKVVGNDEDLNNDGKVDRKDKALAREIDTDRDGKVEWSEKRAYFKQDLDGDGKVTDKEKRTYKNMDLDGDGKVGHFEKRKFERLDKNHDGHLSKSERAADDKNFLERSADKIKEKFGEAKDKVEHKAKETKDKVKESAEEGKSFFKKVGDKVKGAFSRDDDDKERGNKKSGRKEADKSDREPGFIDKMHGREFKPVKNPNIRDFNEDGKVSRDENSAYNSLDSLRKNGKLDDKSFKSAVDNLHDKCRGQENGVSASQVRGGGQNRQNQR